MIRRTACAAILVAALLISTTSCGSIDLGSLTSLFGPGLTLVIENNTDFTAVPDLRSSDSDNIAEDLVADENQIQSFGMNGAVGPHQTMTARLACDSQLNRITFVGADFREGNGFTLGDVNNRITFRRDTDFDCGDTIRITFSGAIFSFTASADVEHSSNDGSLFGSNNNSSNNGNDSSGSDIANMLDRLFH
jgi:hypothetical protein